MLERERIDSSTLTAFDKCDKWCVLFCFKNKEHSLETIFDCKSIIDKYKVDVSIMSFCILLYWLLDYNWDILKNCGDGDEEEHFGKILEALLSTIIQEGEDANLVKKMFIKALWSSDIYIEEKE